MFNFINRLINLGDIKIENQTDRNEFSKSLRELITILFAVVFATGLQQILKFHIADEFWMGTSFWLYFLANLAVVLSWYGYHWGTVNGPKEYNIFCYVIDALLVVLYWLLLNKRGNFNFVLACYSSMFILYFVWEFIRTCAPSEVKKYKVHRAMLINLVFSLLTSGLFLMYYKFKLNLETATLLNEGTYIVILFVILLSYRYIIFLAYKDKKLLISKVIDKKQVEELIKFAKSASEKAKANLSGYKVGAAILGSNGGIYTGCNIEFDNYSNTIHAEEAAISSLISNGELEFEFIAVYTHGEELAFPCGMCRQSLFELGGPNLQVVACNATKHETKGITELLPEGFRL